MDKYKHQKAYAQVSSKLPYLQLASQDSANGSHDLLIQ